MAPFTTHSENHNLGKSLTSPAIVHEKEILHTNNRPSAELQSEIGSVLNFEDLTVYKIDYTAVDEKTECVRKVLKGLVGERGFEPQTPGPEPDSKGY